MKRVLKSVDNNLLKLHKTPLEYLIKFNGIGKAKTVKLNVALEQSKRVYQHQKDKSPVLNHSRLYTNKSVMNSAYLITKSFGYCISINSKISNQLRGYFSNGSRHSSGFRVCLLNRCYPPNFSS